MDEPTDTTPCAWKEPPCSNPRNYPSFWCDHHAAMDPVPPPRQCGGWDGEERCTNMLDRWFHLCWVHDPESWAGIMPGDPTRRPLGIDGFSWAAEAESEELTHVYGPVNAWALPTDPWAQPTKYDEIDRDRRISIALCELPEPCAICDGGYNQCHAFIFGRLCRFPARRARPYCINHDPNYRKEHRQQSRRGGDASARLRHKTPGVEDVSLFLGTRAGVQATIDLIVRLELLGKISGARSRNILRALGIALRNFDRGHSKFRDQDMVDYLNYREDIEAFIPDILKHARNNDSPTGTAAEKPQRKRTTFGELLGSRSNPNNVFSFEEPVPDDAARIPAHLRPQ